MFCVDEVKLVTSEIKHVSCRATLNVLLDLITFIQIATIQIILQ